MENNNKYLEKVIIYNDDSLIGEFRPLIDKNGCQLTSLANNFKSIDINHVFINNNVKTSVLKVSKHRKDKPYSIKLKNSSIKLFRNRRFDEYVLFLCQKPNLAANDEIFLELCKHNQQKHKPKVVQRKAKHKPKNSRNIIGINNIFEERIRDELKKSLQTMTNVSASAIFRTEIPQKPKMFLTQNVANRADVNNFILHMKKFNTNYKKIVNYSIPLKKVQAIIIINQNRRELFVELTDKIAKKTIYSISDIVEYHKKKFINSKSLNIKLRKIGWTKRQNVSDKSSSSLPEKTNSAISINEYSFKSVLDIIHEYHNNMTSFSDVGQVDFIMKDTYKMLVELQLNAIDQCNQLFLNYFSFENDYPEYKIQFKENVKTHYAFLLQLQNKAIENSVFVNRRIKNVNRFLKIIRDRTNNQCMIINPPRKVINTAIKIRVKNFERNRSDNDISSATVEPSIKEIEVQTSLVGIQQLIEKVISLNKCCSPINISDLMEIKSIQTDISINKNTSIDFGGKQVQICRKNINLQMKNKSKPETCLSASEKEIINKLDAQVKPKITPNPVECKDSDKLNKLDTPEQTTPNPVATCETVPPVETDQLDQTEEIDSELFPSTLDEKMAKLSAILKHIQAESRPRSAEPPKLSTIHEEVKIPPKNHEILYQIKNTLELVKDRFEKNSIILRKVSDLKDNYFVSNNIKCLMETGGLFGDFPGKPKFIKASQPEVKCFSSSSTIRSVKKTKEAIAMNLNTSLLLLKNLHEVTKNIKTNPENAMEQLNEIEESIQIQRKLIPKVRYDKMHLTLTPIKNFIASNKMNVSDNATRLPGQKYETKQKKMPLVPTNSKVILDIKSKKPKKKRASPSKTMLPTSRSQTAPTAVVPTTREVADVPKIYRPVNTKVQETPKLSCLTLVDVTPLQPEYPRKDNLSHIEIEKTYLYKLLNNSFSEKSLEPVLKCSSINCTSCTKIQAEKKDKKALKRRDFFKKGAVQPTKSFIWERMNWNNEVTIQADHDFDFNQFMDDPNLHRQQDVTVCPLNVQYERKPNDVGTKTQPNYEKAVKNVQNKHSLNVITSGNLSLKPLSKASTVSQQNKIQKSIQQAIIKNQEKFKFIQQSLSPRSHAPKHKNIPAVVPKIISSGTIQKQKIKLPNRAKHEYSRRPHIPDANVFDTKYKTLPTIPSLDSATSSKHEDAILDTISKTVKKSTDDMQRYIELVEQKFLKTFSMPETEKATAYTSLETEIKDMLHLLNTTKDRKNLKPEELLKELSTQKPKLVKKSSEKTKIPQKTPEVKQKKKPIKKASEVSVIVIKEPHNFVCGSEVAVDKKKVTDKTQPTVCTDPINFSESLAAIVSKQSNLFPSNTKSSTSILKNSSSKAPSTTVSNKSINKRVRFKLDEKKTAKSDSTLTISTDEEYSTFYEDTMSSSLSSGHDFTAKVYTDISILIYLQLTSYTCYPTFTSETYYIIQHYQLEDQDFDTPGNYELKILCKKNTLELLKDESNFGFDDLKPVDKDSLSDFIENCEEIIEATKMLDQKSSTHILEFLDILQSISVEAIFIKVEIFVQLNCYNNNLTHISSVYYIIDTFESITYKKSKQLDFSHLFELFQQQNDELGPILTENNSKLIPFNTKSTPPYKKLQKYFSQPEFTSDLLNYHIKVPFSNDVLPSHSDSRCFDVVTHNSRSKAETICQTLVLNLQVLNCKRRQNSRKTIRKKCYIPPTRKTLQLKGLEVDFDIHKDKFLSVYQPHRVFLILLYVTLFSFAFLCMTLNYRCE